MSIKLNDDVLNLITQTGKNINRYNQIISEKTAKPLDRTYTGRIMSIGENNKCQVMYSNKSCWVEMADNNTHYINELVRVYVPNGDIDKAYCESVEPVPCSNVIISKNQMVFCTKVKDADSQKLIKEHNIPDDAVSTYTPIYSAAEGGKGIQVEKTEVDEIKVIQLVRDDRNRPVLLTYPNGKVVAVKYSEDETNY